MDQVIAEADIVNLRGDVPGRKAMYAAIRAHDFGGMPAPRAANDAEE